MFLRSWCHRVTPGPLEPPGPPRSTEVQLIYSDPWSAVLVHAYLAPDVPGPPLPFSWLSRILALTPLSHLEPPSYIPSTPGPLPPSTQSHSDLSCSSPTSISLLVFDFYHLLFLSTAPPCNLILLLPLQAFLRASFECSVLPLVFAYDLLFIHFTCGLPLSSPWHNPDCPGSASGLYWIFSSCLAADQLFPGPRSVHPVFTSFEQPWLWGPWGSLGSAITILFQIRVVLCPVIASAHSTAIEIYNLYKKILISNDNPPQVDLIQKV